MGNVNFLSETLKAFVVIQVETIFRILLVDFKTGEM